MILRSVADRAHQRWAIRFGAILAMMGAAYLGYVSKEKLTRGATPLGFEQPRVLADLAGDSIEERGRWHRTAPMAAARAEDVKRITALGYVSGSTTPSGRGVTKWDRERTAPGINIYTSGHAPEAVLMRADGRVIHRWRFDYETAFGGRRFPWTRSGIEHWRRVRLLSDGGLIAIYEGQGLIRIDRNSRLVWALPIAAHHDVVAVRNGDFYVLTREVGDGGGRRPRSQFLEDFLVVVSADGHVLRKMSILEAFRRSRYAPLLAGVTMEGDIFHTNTLSLIEEGNDVRIPGFVKGNVLISVPTIDVVAVIDIATETVVWMLSGMWRFQHQPTLVGRGKLLLLDNQGVPGLSRALEIDPVTQAVTWSYGGRPDQSFYTEFCGSVQRLENSNTLIVETDRGRVFEVTRDGAIVWEFFNPERAGANREFIASVFDLVRLTAASVPGIFQ
jgi:hypothetical protein